ncbi:MAG: hypothetical protein HZC28_09545 [Spirochaetes bacterium]|nr:hypothetical protein [Spirochaetota bacterium]
MKRSLMLLALMFVCGMLPVFAERKMRVGILAFAAKGVTATEAGIVEELFRSEIVASGRFDLLDRSNMDSLLKEQAFQQTGCTESTCAVNVGKMLNMEYMMYGAVMKLGRAYIVSTGMVDIETGKVVNTAREQCDAIEKTEASVKKIVAQLAGIAPRKIGVTAQWANVLRNAPFSARSAMAVTVYNGSLWLTGGYENATKSTKRDVWRSPDGTNWFLAAKTAGFFDRNRHGVAAFNDALWLAGGYQANVGAYNDVWKSKDGTNWDNALKSSAFTIREGHALLPFKNKLTLIAGFEFREPKNDVWSSADGTGWIRLTEHAGFNERSAAAAVVFNNKLWLIGGRGEGRTNYNDVWSSDDGKSWQPVMLHAAFSPRSGHAALVHGNAMWLIGGLEDRTAKNDVWRSTDGKTWTRMPEQLFGPRFLHAAVSFNGSIWILGGSGDDAYETQYNDVWCLE